MIDRILVEGDVDAAAVDVTLAAGVPGDHPVGVLDQDRAHELPPVVGGAGARTWQATRWSSATSTSAGTSTRQRGCTSGQRVWKRQPGGGRSGLGTSPASTALSRRR